MAIERRKISSLLFSLSASWWLSTQQDLSIPAGKREVNVFVALLFYMQWMCLFLGLFFNVPLFKLDIIWSWQLWLFKLYYFSEYFCLYSSYIIWHIFIFFTMWIFLNSLSGKLRHWLLKNIKKNLNCVYSISLLNRARWQSRRKTSFRIYVTFLNSGRKKSHGHWLNSWSKPDLGRQSYYLCYEQNFSSGLWNPSDPRAKTVPHRRQKVEHGKNFLYCSIIPSTITDASLVTPSPPDDKCCLSAETEGSALASCLWAPSWRPFL